MPPIRPANCAGDVKLQRRGDLIEQHEGRQTLPVDLVDEGDDRDVAQAADFEQLPGLRLDALRGVDHHDRAVDRGQRPVGVFREILVARRVEQVEQDVADFERHNRGGDGDAALLLDLHPVGPRAAAVAAGAHFARLVDRAREVEQLLGQRRLAGVGVGDDRKGAPLGRHAFNARILHVQGGRVAHLERLRGLRPGRRRMHGRIWDLPCV
jgi:hypothetical protein